MITLLLILFIIALVIFIAHDGSVTTIDEELAIARARLEIQRQELENAQREPKRLIDKTPGI